MNGEIFPQPVGARGHLRLVPQRPPRPRRPIIEVRISGIAPPVPYARTRPFRLTPGEFEQLVAIAEKMEARSS